MEKTSQAAAAKKTEIFERAERYVKEYRAQENDSIRFRREAKAAGNIHVPAEVRATTETTTSCLLMLGLG